MNRTTEIANVREAVALLHRKVAAQTPLLSRLVNGTTWSALAGLLNQGGTLVTTVLVARILGREGFGQYAILLSTLMSVAALAQAGLGLSAAKHIAEFRSVDKAKTARILALCNVLCPLFALLVSLAIIFSAPILARLALGSESLSTALRVGAFFIFFTAVNGLQTAALTGLERYRALFLPGLVSSAGTMVFVAAGAATAGVTGAVSGLAAASSLRCLLHYGTLKAQLTAVDLSPVYKGCWAELRSLQGFALPATLSGYLMLPTLWFASALLVKQPSGYKEMASFAAAQNLRVAVMFIPLLINSVGLSMLNNARRGSAAGSYRSVRRMNLLTLVGVTAISALLMAAISQPALRIFGEEFAATGGLLVTVLLAGAVVESALLGFFQSIQAAGEMWKAFFLVTIPWQAVFLVSASWFIPREGSLGLAMAHLFGLTSGLLATAILATMIEGRRSASALRPEPLRLLPSSADR